jgi:hypothetical protein
MSRLDAMAEALESRFRDGPTAPWSDAEFERRALDAFGHQFEACAPYGAFCARRGATPGEVATWEEVPAVPATAFKHLDLYSGGGRAPEAIFRTSGTTRGTTRRGCHHVPRLELYRAACVGPFGAAVVPDGGRLPFVSLIPAPPAVPDSSLSFMVGAVADRFASETHWVVDAEGRWTDDVEDLFAARRAAGEPVALLGTALAFVHLLERAGPGSLSLPEGSRVMETGGFKGVGRSTTREELHGRIAMATGIAPARIVNEYGMTELLSQLYEPVLTEGLAAKGWHAAPPWLRVRALDPSTLRGLPDGQEGILSFFDLANLGSICHVMTEDIGSVREGRVRLRGRTLGAEPRGCSRAMDELMGTVS